ncbi:MAG: hypothetical protein ACLTE2_08520 [Eubacteriales bacterium]
MLNMGFLEQVKAIISHLPEHPVTLIVFCYHAKRN